MKTRTLILVALLAGILSSCKSDLEKRAERFEQDVEQIREQLQNTGLQVVYVENNKIVYTHSFGYKNVERQEPLTDDCLFRIASISKSFTTTSLMQLVEKGMVSLDTDVSTLAGFPIRNPRFPETVITLEMLLSHTSSINDSEGYFTLDVINPEMNENATRCYNEYEPGHGYEYCNLNLNLAGTFLERLSGERFDQYVVHHVLDPLGLYGGYCVDSLDASRFASLYQESSDPEFDYYNPSAEAADNRLVCTDADAYEPRSERILHYRMGYDTPVFSPTGGMKLSATDLAKYMLVHMNYGTTPDGVRIIPETLSRSMQTPRSEDENYGLTLWQTDLYTPGHMLVGHTGGAYGMRSAMFFDPEAKYGFVVISGGALENEPESAANTDPSGSNAASGNILTRTIRLMYHDFRE